MAMPGSHSIFCAEAGKATAANSVRSSAVVGQNGTRPSGGVFALWMNHYGLKPKNGRLGHRTVESEPRPETADVVG